MSLKECGGLLSETVTRREALIDSMKSQHAQMVEIQKQLDVAKEDAVFALHSSHLARTVLFTDGGFRHSLLGLLRGGAARACYGCTRGT